MGGEGGRAAVGTGGALLGRKARALVRPVGGLLKRGMYSYGWGSLRSGVYCTEGRVRATSDTAPSSYYAWAEVVLCILLFTACTLHIRLRLKAAKTMQQQA